MKSWEVASKQLSSLLNVRYIHFVSFIWVQGFVVFVSILHPVLSHFSRMTELLAYSSERFYLTDKMISELISLRFFFNRNFPSIYMFPHKSLSLCSTHICCARLAFNLWIWRHVGLCRMRRSRLLVLKVQNIETHTQIYIHAHVCKSTPLTLL